MTIVLDHNNREINFEASVEYMDDDIRERLHPEGIRDPQEFFEAYAEAHYQKFKEAWAPYSGGAW